MAGLREHTQELEVAADDTPLVDEPAVRPLLDALRATLDLGVTDPQDPSYLDPDQAKALAVLLSARVSNAQMKAARWARLL